MDQIGVRRALGVPLALMIAMLVSAAVVSTITGVSGWRVFMPYFGAWASVTLLSVLLWMFLTVAAMARRNADRPLATVAAGIAARPPQLYLLPALIFPVFIGAYTWAKCSIPLAVGYGWEQSWADADRAILGVDAWRIAHRAIPPSMGHYWSFFYAVIWGFVLVASGGLISAFAGRRHVARFFTAMMLSWFVGGFVMAYLISAGGPVFAHLADPDMAPRFAGLRESLAAILGPDDIVMTSQRYLALGMEAKVAVKGGGVSAMPSMHIATATVLALAAGRSWWLAPALLFWVLTFVGSIYLGYHYAVDAPVAALVAAGSWGAAKRLFP